MAGRPGRSGGANRIPVADHLTRGTYRRDRHGEAWRAWDGPEPPPDPVQPPSWLLRGLGTSGKRFLRDLYSDCVVGRVEGHIGRIAAECLDDLAAARRVKDVKAARAASRQFLTAVQRLGLPTAEKP